MSVTVTAVFGGAFSPPHVGHATVASWILWTGLADQVLLVPAASHPFGKQMASFQRRLAYCRALAQDIDPGAGRVTWDESEGQLPAPNYSINLLRHLRSRYAHHTLRFVMGADNLARRADWHGFDDIIREFDPIFVNREGVILPAGVEVMSPMFPNISSTEIRARIAAGAPIDHLVTTSVLQLVREDYAAETR